MHIGCKTWSIILRKNLLSVFVLCFSMLLLTASIFEIGGYLHYNYVMEAYGQVDNSPGFQDSYWTDNLSSIPGARQIKQEVGPGEGASTLAIVLVNKARQDITSVRGVLSLPDGFEAAAGTMAGSSENNTSHNSSGIRSVDASLNSVVKAGDTFTLYFDVNVLDNAKVGQYFSNLKLIYSKVLDLGNIEINIPIQFRVPGKVIMDANIISTDSLGPGAVNNVPISIRNLGSANANGVTISLKDISRSNLTSSSDSLVTSTDQSASSVNLGSTTFDLGRIPQNSSKTINTLIYPGFDASGNVQNLDLQISYGDAYGNRKQSSSVVGMVIAPKPPESVISVRTLVNESGTSQEPESGSSMSDMTDKDNRNALIVTAGQIEDLKFVISNNSSNPVSNLVLTLSSPSDSVKIVGDSKWTLNVLLPQAQQVFDTKVFAAKSVVGTPVLFNLGLNYIFNGDTKTDKLDLGAYVTGQFKIRAYDFNVTNIAGVPNLVANLLNEGNSLAMFTTVEMINNSVAPSNNKLVTALPPAQYLGDLDENSPLPLSIPLIIPNNLQAGSYPVSLKITYKDDLRAEHIAIVNGTVFYQPQVQSNSTSGGFLGSTGGNTSILPIMIGIAALIVIVLVILLRRRKRSKLKFKLEQSQGEDLSFDTDSSISRGPNPAYSSATSITSTTAEKNKDQPDAGK
jgi:LPXTG-motif cell wall-anchored protein